MAERVFAMSVAPLAHHRDRGLPTFHRAYTAVVDRTVLKGSGNFKMNDFALNRRNALSLPVAGLGAALIGGMVATSLPAQAAADASLLPATASKLRRLTAALAAAPRARTFKSVPMILTNPTQWDSAALDLLFTYEGGPKQVWDNTDLEGPWLSVMRNSMNAQIWSWGHPDFVAISATHGTAHLALYDDYIWTKYLAAFTNGKYTSNIWIKTPPAGEVNPADYQDPDGAFSPAANSIAVLQRRGVVFCACHNAVWELTAALIKKRINPGRLSHPEMAAEFTNHLVTGVVLTPGAVGTIPQLQLAGYQYAA